MADSTLTKIHIDLPLHWRAKGESLWAEALGSDLFRIRNIPFLAYDLNFADVVRATPDAPDLKPEVREVVERIGHRTFRVFFEETHAPESPADLLKELNRHTAYFERATAADFAIDVEPDGSYEDVYDQLIEWEEAGFLYFETCGAREPGSFDDRPVH